MGGAPPSNPPQVELLIYEKILEYCKTPRLKKEIIEYCGYRDRKNFEKKYLKPLIDSGKLQDTEEKKHSKIQKYVTVEKEMK